MAAWLAEKLGVSNPSQRPEGCCSSRRFSPCTWCWTSTSATKNGSRNLHAIAAKAHSSIPKRGCNSNSISFIPFGSTHKAEAQVQTRPIGTLRQLELLACTAETRWPGANPCNADGHRWTVRRCSFPVKLVYEYCISKLYDACSMHCCPVAKTLPLHK